MSERLTVMATAAYLSKLVRGCLPNLPEKRHTDQSICLCQFTEECLIRFVHALDIEDVGVLADLFRKHLLGYVSGSVVHKVTTEIFHRLQ